MARRRKTASKPPVRRKRKATGSHDLVRIAEHAVLNQSSKMLAGATKRYKRFVRQAAKATNDANKRKYLAAALSAVVVAGVVANDLRQRIAERPLRATTSARKKLRKQRDRAR
jgi:hypothetical protein